MVMSGRSARRVKFDFIRFSIFAFVILFRPFSAGQRKLQKVECSKEVRTAIYTTLKFNEKNNAERLEQNFVISW